MGDQEGQSPGCWGPTWERTRELEGGWRSARGWQSVPMQTPLSALRGKMSSPACLLSTLGVGGAGWGVAEGGGSLPGLACILSELGSPPSADRCQRTPAMQGVMVLGAGSGLPGAFRLLAGVPSGLATLLTWIATPELPTGA